MRISILAVSLVSLCLPGAAFGQGSTIAPSVSCSDIHSAPDCNTLARGRGGNGLGSARTVPLNRPSPVAIGGSRVNTGTTGTRSTIGTLGTTSGGIATLRPAVPTPRAVGPLNEAVPGTTDGSSVGPTGTIGTTGAIGTTGTTGTTHGVGPLPPVAPNSSPGPSGDELDELLDGGSSSGGVR